jgi:transposase
MRHSPLILRTGGNKEMLIVETIRKVRLALAKGESQRGVAKKYRMSRNTVKKTYRRLI